MEEREESKGNFLIYFLMIVAIVLVFLSIYLVFRIDKPIQTQVYDAYVTVDEKVYGVDINGSALTFGKLPPKSKGTRTVNITNNYGFSVEVKVSATESIRDLISNPGNISLEPGENAEISLTMAIPEGTPIGDYSGKVKFELYRAEDD